METIRKCPICTSLAPTAALECPVCGSKLAGSPPLDRRMLRNGELRLLRRLGRGGMGRLYLAETTSGEFRVVKELLVLPNKLGSGTREAMFEEEARMLHRLGHDYDAVPRYYDSFMDSGAFYIVLEFVPGQDLEQHLLKRGTPLPCAEAMDYMKQVVDLLASLHNLKPHPIVHGDIKPSNLILRPDGRIVVIDFGLAQVNEPLPEYLPASSTAFGTPGYMPLEQWQGRPGPASDIFALGATIHQLVTGRDPRAPFSQLTQVSSSQLGSLTQVPPIGALVSSSSVLLETLIMQMTRRNPRERPSAMELQLRLS